MFRICVVVGAVQEEQGLNGEQVSSGKAESEDLCFFTLLKLSMFAFS